MKRLIAALALMAATSVSAQGLRPSNCAAHDVVSKRLTDMYKETPRHRGLAGPRMLVEMWASDETGTWSITVTMPDGRMCLVGSGRGYETLDAAETKPGDDT